MPGVPHEGSLGSNKPRKTLTQITTQQGKKYPYEKRLEVVQKYLVLGNMRLVADLAGISYQTLRLWKTQEWWKDLVTEIRAARNITLDNKMTALVDRSLDLVGDRLENGEMYFDVKTQEWARRPVNLTAALKATDTLLNQQNILAKKEQVETGAQAAATVADTIKGLLTEFAKFTKKPQIEVVDVEDAKYAVHDEREEGLQEAVREVRWTPEEHQEAGRNEQGPESDGEGGAGTQGGWQGRGSQDSAESWGDVEPEQPEGDDGASQSLFQPKL